MASLSSQSMNMVRSVSADTFGNVIEGNEGGFSAPQRGMIERFAWPTRALFVVQIFATHPPFSAGAALPSFV